MASISHTYRTSIVRYGGPRRRPTISRYENLGLSGIGDTFGSHAPIDTQIHWQWTNPLNLIPLLLLVIAVIGFGALLVSSI